MCAYISRDAAERVKWLPFKVNWKCSSWTNIGERERGLKDVFGTRPNPFVERSFYTHTFNIYWRWEKDLKFFSKKGKEEEEEEKKMFSPYDFLWGHKMDRTPVRERKSRVIREYCAACGIVETRESLPLQPKLFNPQGRRRRRRRSWNNIRCTLKTSKRTGPFLVYVIFSQIARWDGNRLLIEGVTSLGRRGRTRQFVASTMAHCLPIGITTHVRSFAIRVDDEQKFLVSDEGGHRASFSFFALVGTKATDHYIHFVQLHHLQGMYVWRRNTRLWLPLLYWLRSAHKSSYEAILFFFFFFYIKRKRKKCCHPASNVIPPLHHVEIYRRMNHTHKKISTFY